MGGSLMTLFFIFISFDDSERGVWDIFFFGYLRQHVWARWMGEKIPG